MPLWCKVRRPAVAICFITALEDRALNTVSMTHRIFSLFFWLSVSLGIKAQSDTIAGKTHRIDEVTVSAKRVSKNVVSSKPVQVADRQELEKLGLVNLAEAVKKFAGTSVKDYGGIGGMKTVSVRNLGAHHTAVDYDGITVSNTQAGQIDIGRFPIDNVQSISLAMGEQEDLTQSARHLASAGVLSIVTEKPDLNSKNIPFSLQTGWKGGSFGYVEPHLRMWYQPGNRTLAGIQASWMRADGIYPFTLVNGQLVTKEKRINSDIHSWHYEANLFHTFKDNSELQAKAHHSYSERGLPGAVIFYNSDSDERLWDEDFFAQLMYKKRLNRWWQMAARGKFAHSWTRYEDKDVKYEDGLLRDVDRQDEYYLSITSSWQPSRHFSVALAEDVFWNQLRTTVDEGALPTRFTTLTALSMRYATARFLLNANMVGTYAKESVKAGQAPPDKHRLSPSLSASFRLLNDQSLYLRASWKNTFRVPTFNDLYYRRMGTRKLLPEKAVSYNIGFTWNCRPTGILRYASMTLDGYFNFVDDKIVAFPSTYIWKMVNYGKVHIKGLDATLAAEVSLPRQMSITLLSAYSLQKAIEKTDPKKSTYNSLLPYTPIFYGNASVILNNPWVNVGYSVDYSGKRYSSSMNTEPYKLEPYQEHSITLSRQFKFKHSALKLQASVKNFTNEQYDIIKYYPMPGRTWNISGTFIL